MTLDSIRGAVHLKKNFFLQLIHATFFLMSIRSLLSLNDVFFLIFFNNYVIDEKLFRSKRPPYQALFGLKAYLSRMVLFHDSGSGHTEVSPKRYSIKLSTLAKGTGYSTHFMCQKLKTQPLDPQMQPSKLNLCFPIKSGFNHSS